MSDAELPHGSCDCHVHVFADAGRYPPAPSAAYPPPDVRLTQLQKMHTALGIERAVLVQPTIYGNDHRLLLNLLRNRPQYRGVAIVNDALSDDDLSTLHKAGIRAARLSLGGPLGGMSPAELERSANRVCELGWHVKFGGTARDFIANRSWLRRLKCTAVLDHIAGANPADGLADDLIRLAEGLLCNGNWWILLANADRRSQRAFGWDDMLPYLRRFVSAAPKRAIWGTDWPHVLYGNRAIPDDRQLVAFLRMVAPDQAALEDILVRNPSQLYGFPSPSSD